MVTAYPVNIVSVMTVSYIIPDTPSVHFYNSFISRCTFRSDILQVTHLLKSHNIHGTECSKIFPCLVCFGFLFFFNTDSDVVF